MRYMAKENLDRMIKLADEFFETKNDPAQISVTAENMKILWKIHPNTMTEKKDKNGPIAWVLLIPTTLDLMKKFITNKINERELLDNTPRRGKYEAIYLCSALVLPEHRGKGLAKRLISKSIKSIQKQHPIKYLFYWSFSAEGKKLAASVAKELDLPLHQRKA
jgi:GNAT superfamily N-acetyltransferase